MFDIIQRAHIQTGHGGRDKMTKYLTNYANITRESIELYKSLCTECQKKRKRPIIKGVVVRPILSKHFYHVVKKIWLICNLCLMNLISGSWSIKTT